MKTITVTREYRLLISGVLRGTFHTQDEALRALEAMPAGVYDIVPAIQATVIDPNDRSAPSPTWNEDGVIRE